MVKELEQFSEAVAEALHEVASATYEQIDKGLDKAMDHMVDRLVDATPVESGLTRDSWETNDKYKNVRYINNPRLNDKGIPVANLLEYGERGKPFIRQTVKKEEEKIISIIQEEIKGDT